MSESTQREQPDVTGTRSAKRIVKRAIRPFARPLIGRLQGQQEQIDQIAQYLPLLVNAISTQNATAREFERYRADLVTRLDDCEARLVDVQAELARMAEVINGANDLAGRLDDTDTRLAALAGTIATVERRSEFIRRETMYEARYGARSAGIGQGAPAKVDPELISAKGLLRLNLGSGHVPKEGFVNVDARKLDGVDVVADVRKLPFPSQSVDEIYSSHLVEHFPIEELRRVILPHWLELLRPGGQLVAVTPDAETMINEAAAGRMAFEELQRVTFGDQEYDGDFHFAMFTPDSFAALLTEAGFVAVEVVARGRLNGACYEFEIRTERPSEQTDVAPSDPSTE